MKLYYFYTLKALWDGQGKIKMYYGKSRVKNQLSGKRSIEIHSTQGWTATTRQGVTRKRSTKRLKHTANV